MAKIIGRDKRIADWLEKIGIDPKTARRVVIDISVDSPVYLYIERYGDSTMFEVEPPPELTTAIHLVPPQDDFEEAIKIIKGLKASEQPILDEQPLPSWKAAQKEWRAIQACMPIKQGDDPPITKLKREDKPTPEWLAEFEAKQQENIKKWEHLDD